MNTTGKYISKYYNSEYYRQNRDRILTSRKLRYKNNDAYRATINKRAAIWQRIKRSIRWDRFPVTFIELNYIFQDDKDMETLEKILPQATVTKNNEPAYTELQVKLMAQALMAGGDADILKKYWHRTDWENVKREVIEYVKAKRC